MLAISTQHLANLIKRNPPDALRKFHALLKEYPDIDLNARSGRENNTHLVNAIYDCPQIAIALIHDERVDVNCRSYLRNYAIFSSPLITPLALAIIEGEKSDDKKRAARSLAICHRVDPNKRLGEDSPYGNTCPLFLAFNWDAPDEGIIWFLLEHENLDPSNLPHGWPLHHYNQSSSSQVRSLVTRVCADRIEKGEIDLSFKDKNGMTFWMNAISKKVDVADYFKLAPESLDIADDNGNTILLQLASLPEDKYTLKHIKALLQARANPFITNKKNQSALNSARRKKEFIALIQDGIKNYGSSSLPTPAFAPPVDLSSTPYAASGATLHVNQLPCPSEAPEQIRRWGFLSGFGLKKLFRNPTATQEPEQSVQKVGRQP